MRFIYNGTEYPEATKMTLAEVLYLEKKLGEPLEEWTGTARIFSTMYVSVKRVSPGALKWEKLMEIPVTDIEEMVILDEEPPPDDEPEYVPDPTIAGGPEEQSS